MFIALGVHADNVFLRNGNSDHWPTKSKQFGARKTGKPDARAFISVEPVVWCTLLKAFISHVNVKGNGDNNRRKTEKKKHQRQDVAFGGAPHSKCAGSFQSHSKLHVSITGALFSLYSCATADNEWTIILTVLTFFHLSWHLKVCYLVLLLDTKARTWLQLPSYVCLLSAFSGERI